MIPLPLLILGVIVGVAAFLWWSEVYMPRKHMKEAIREAQATRKRLIRRGK